MATTYVGTNDPKAVKLFSVVLLQENVRNSDMLTMLSDGTSAVTKGMAAAQRRQVQTGPGMPIVVASDLRKRRGDRVSVDFLKQLSGKPIMGSKMAEGRGQNLSFDTMEFVIDQTRFPVQPGDKMSQRRTVHDLRDLSKASISNYFGRLYDNRIMIHLAGARGMDNKGDWIVPLDTDPDFASIMVNPVSPPTSNRYFVAGDGETVSDMDDADALKLDDLDVMKAYLKELAYPIAPIKLTKNDPLWCMFVTQRQWLYLLARYGRDSVSWRNFLAAATTRRAMTNNHPLFTGECGIWNGFLIKRVDRPIRFFEGDTVKVKNSKTKEVTTSTVPSKITVDRALIVGAQAMAYVLGDGQASGSGRSPFPIYWNEVMLDHNDKMEILGKIVDGFGKFTFEQSDGELTDHGVAVLDSYAPDPKTVEGVKLRDALQS